ncbi:hypothetical protein HELRODRAFT_178307 [Helobdella robusta]|uniref:Uncharacterized protein n=1 Tax=Helobdella robusta TaxID=6412 RepID=T1FD22_HELRO|nr:hypothetical protein HELRODRAFT_178307 [Helobdella robusta]ESN97193.1 hypothetical protein HELRODRAFT_178307 [Helobdella robusta]
MEANLNGDILMDEEEEKKEEKTMEREYSLCVIVCSCAASVFVAAVITVAIFTVTTLKTNNNNSNNASIQTLPNPIATTTESSNTPTTTKNVQQQPVADEVTTSAATSTAVAVTTETCRPRDATANYMPASEPTFTATNGTYLYSKNSIKKALFGYNNTLYNARIEFTSGDSKNLSVAELVSLGMSFENVEYFAVLVYAPPGDVVHSVAGKPLYNDKTKQESLISNSRYAFLSIVIGLTPIKPSRDTETMTILIDKRSYGRDVTYIGGSRELFRRARFVVVWPKLVWLSPFYPHLDPPLATYKCVEFELSVQFRTMR